jgi:hypothetical protein
MKTFLSFLLISCIISIGLTFFLFAEKKEEIDPIREQYAQVFSEFGKNAEDMYSQYNTYGLKILQDHRVEGLRVLKLYGHLIESLQPYMDSETLFSICHQHGTQLEELLELFQPSVIAEVYTQFGIEALQYMLDEPEVYFLLLEYGDRIVQLANAKGPVVFALIRKHPPEFIELYYDDALFKAINRFGVDGLMAIKKYRGMATVIFNLFADDDRFAGVLRKYGYQQVVPVLYYFYQMQNETITTKERAAKFEIDKLFQQETEDGSELPASEKRDQITREYKQFDQANWALSRIHEQGNTFLRQFDISENGNVSPLQVVVVTNMFEDLLMNGLQRKASPISPGPNSEEEGIPCDQLTAVLNILGLLPHETLFSTQARCLYLRTGLSDVTSPEGIEGLVALDEHEDLVARYGNTAISFIAQYGREGIQLLEQTDGEILQFAMLYGRDLVHFTIKYGPEVLTLVNEFGAQMIEAIQETNGEVIPYTQKYGKDVFKVLEQPEGKAILSLGSVFGEEILQYTIQYPGDFPRYLFKYGKPTMTALHDHGDSAVAPARKYGDDVILYIGLYGDRAIRIVRTGEIGVSLLRVIPEDLWEKYGEQLVQYGLPGTCFRLLINHPRKFHEYIGLLGEEIFAVGPRLLQLVFWTITAFLTLNILRFLYKGIKRIF